MTWPMCEHSSPNGYRCQQDARGYDGKHLDLCTYHAKVKLRLLLPWTPGPSRHSAGRPTELPYIATSAIGAHR